MGLEVDDTPLESLEPPDGAVRAPHALYLHCGRLQLLGLVQLSARVHTSPVRLLTTYGGGFIKKESYYRQLPTLMIV